MRLNIFFRNAMLAAGASLLSASLYAANPKPSVLSEGRWVKISVSQEGIVYLPFAQLRKMGFSDPGKVRVYGYGGREIPEITAVYKISDPILQPIIADNSGISFFAAGNVCFEASNGEMPFKRIRNRYSDDIFYYLTDSRTDSLPEAVDAKVNPANSNNNISWHPVLHEKEVSYIANTSPIVLGEDFRAQNSQRFELNLPDAVDEPAKVEIRFGTATGSGTSSIVIKNGNETLQPTTADVFPPVNTAERFIRLQSSVKTIENPSEKLNLQISWSPGGAIKAARLDYILAAYRRRLHYSGKPLQFYYTSDGKNLAVTGASTALNIWDVTNHFEPKCLNYELRGDSAIFYPLESGLRTYIAFEHGKGNSSIPDFLAIANQDIHSMQAPDMLIIAPHEYASAANRIAELHSRHDAIQAIVLTPSEIYNEFSSGTPDPGAYRKLLYYWNSLYPGKTRYCLLLGRPTYAQRSLGKKRKGAELVLMWQEPDADNQTDSYGTDDYIGLLEGFEREFDIAASNLGVAVGRMPVSSVAEADAAADKIQKYMESRDFDQWRNRVLIIADDQDNGAHLEQSETNYKAMAASPFGSAKSYERLYLDSYPLSLSGTGPTYPEAHNRLLQAFDRGTALINYTGHANATSWGHEGLLTQTDIAGLNNRRLPFIIAATCEFARWDDDKLSGAEQMWLNKEGGAIGFICPSRTAYINQNGLLNASISRRIFARNADGTPKRIGDAYREGKNGCAIPGDNKLRFVLLGDPAMLLPYPQLSVSIDSIAGLSLEKAAESGNLPTLAARSKTIVKGRVVNPDGTTASDFNGVAYPVLFDAEVPVETYGNGPDGKVMVYNDRKNRLYSGKTEVKNGEWTATLMLPSAIENNYSPALLNVYACSDAGTEAAGATDNFYVYGYAENIEEDTEGPDIKFLALNTPGFKNGQLVNPSPMVLAEISDPSGINVAPSSVGHSLTLTLDGSKVFSDVCDFYSPELANPGAGSIAYPLTDLEPGEHTLRLTAWDNADNSSYAEITFTVALGLAPDVIKLSASQNPARTAVVFTIKHDRPGTRIVGDITVHDLSGRHLRTLKTSEGLGGAGELQAEWDLRDFSGARVPNGIYIYRATVAMPDGSSTSAAHKLFVKGI